MRRLQYHQNKFSFVLSTTGSLLARGGWINMKRSSHNSIRTSHGNNFKNEVIMFLRRCKHLNVVSLWVGIHSDFSLDM